MLEPFLHRFEHEVSIEEDGHRSELSFLLNCIVEEKPEKLLASEEIVNLQLMTLNMKLHVGSQTFIIVWDFHRAWRVKGENLFIYGFACAVAGFLHTLGWSSLCVLSVWHRL